MNNQLYVDYRYQKATRETDSEEKIQSIYGKMRLQLTDHLSVNGENEYNFATNQRIKTGVGFTYQAQCWSFDFKFTNQPDDWSVGFKVELTGLGEIHY